jgi:hypothetical protein
MQDACPLQRELQGSLHDFETVANAAAEVDG